MPIEVEIANEQDKLPIDEERLVAAARLLLRSEGITAATISLAVVDDPTIHELNRRHLGHDYATDVLSFVLEASPDRFEGEVIVSADTAISSAGRFDWSPADELLLYVIHGCLHLAGHDDQTDEARAIMRDREKHYLAEFGLLPRYEE